MHHCTLISLRVRYGLRPCGTSPEPVLHRLSPGNRSSGHCLPDAVSVSPNLLSAGKPTGLGRRRELHPPAPFAAAPALLEACSYSVCSVPGWRPETCRDGVPACPFGRVCLQFGGLLAEPSTSRRRFTEQATVRASQLGLHRGPALTNCLSYSGIA